MTVPTVAPGLGNAMGMLYDAMRANVPLLVTAGDQDLSFNVTEPLLAGDLVAMATPLCKFATRITRIEDLPRVLHRAVKTAMAAPRGPVFIALPGDVLMSSATNLDLLKPTIIPSMQRGDLAAIKHACELILASENPVIICGDAVTQSDAVKELVQFAETVGCKVYDETVCSQAAFPSSHPLYAGSLMRQSAAVQKVMSEHDLCISIGGDMWVKIAGGTCVAHPSTGTHVSTSFRPNNPQVHAFLTTPTKRRMPPAQLLRPRPPRPLQDQNNPPRHRRQGNREKLARRRRHPCRTESRVAGNERDLERTRDQDQECGSSAEA